MCILQARHLWIVAGEPKRLLRLLLFREDAVLRSRRLRLDSGALSYVRESLFVLAFTLYTSLATQLILPGSREITITRGQTALNASHDLLVIPNTQGDVKIGVESLFMTPLYWRLPDTFLGDRILSYNGFLRFTTWSNGGSPFSPGVLQEYPLVQVVGNHKVVLEHFPRKVSNNGRYEVR